MEVYRPTFNEDNDKARAKFKKIVEKHLEELKAAYDEYQRSDSDDSERREQELDDYLCKGFDEKKKVICHHVLLAIHEAYPRPPKPLPKFFERPAVPVVKSIEEARRKGLVSFAIIDDGPEYDVPEAWKDPNIQWVGSNVTEVNPTLGDMNHPARLTSDGKVYYRDNE